MKRHGFGKNLCMTTVALAVWAMPVGSALSEPEGKELDFMVIGVIASSKANAGFALIKQKSSGKVLTQQEGSEISKGTKIVRVETRVVTFIHGGEEIQVEVGSDVGKAVQVGEPRSDAVQLGEGISKSGNELRVEAKLKERLVSDQLQNILMQAAMEAHVENGSMRGFRIWEIEPGSIFELAGFKNGDLITHINGAALKDAAAAIATLRSLKEATEVEVTYEPGGGGVPGSEPQVLKIVVQ